VHVGLVPDCVGPGGPLDVEVVETTDVLVDKDVAVGDKVVLGSTHMRTQYAKSTIRLEHASFITGLYCRNNVWLILYLDSNVEQVSPVLTTCHLLQLSGTPVWMGPGAGIPPSGITVEMVG